MINNLAIKLGVLFFVFSVIFGCASLPQPDEIKGQVANYQLPKLPENGKAIVYVVRSSIDCKTFSFSVFIDNQKPESEMGSTKGRHP